MMELTILGHAGFCLETSGAIVVMDPWLSPYGAFDSSWFQFPRNHHLADFVREKLANSRKERFIYVSHEHRDHFDEQFLKSLNDKDFTFLVPKFQRSALRDLLAQCSPKALISCAHEQEVAIPGGLVKLFLDDSGLNRDSGILVQAEGEVFLNLNDCKLYDELSGIVRKHGPISVFSCQFSGATWHPTCYDYSPEEYAAISGRKRMSKFEMVARGIETVQPRVYLPSAGPACFLDPMLMHLNFEDVNIFPRAPQFIEYLHQRLPNLKTQFEETMPGDVLDVKSRRFLSRASERVAESNFRSYIESYAAGYRDHFSKFQVPYAKKDLDDILERVREALLRKLAEFTLHDRIRVPLYFGLSDPGGLALKIDFPARTVEVAATIQDSDNYSVTAPAWQIARILDGHITWEEFALTFRMRLNRKPDVYQTLIQGFLLMEPEDMNWFCDKLINIEQRKQRAVVEAGGTRYSIDRFCPHQGGDLCQGWVDQGRLWVCPRHRWEFALDKEGRCLTSNASIHAVCLEGE